MEKPLVSICIPVYNCEKYIYGAINSAMSQTYKNIEIIVYDDGSVDDTATICKYFGDRVRYIKGEKNMGIGYGRKRLAEEAKGEYVVYLSADDLMGNVFVEKMMEVASPEKILYCGFLMINEYGTITDSYEPSNFSSHDDFCVACYELAKRYTMFVNFSCTLIPKKVFEKVNFDPDFRLCEDLDFLLMSMIMFKYEYVPLKMVKYRSHSSMTTNKKWNEIEIINKKIIEKFEKRLGVKS